MLVIHSGENVDLENLLFMPTANKLFLLLFIFISSISIAQKRTITGKIADASSNNPIEGASVKIKGKPGGTITSKEGTYSIQAETGDVLIITSIGYSELSFPV